MGTPYSRQDTSNNIADGNVIDAVDLDNEFDQLEAAFNSATGHTHDGTVGEGAPIESLGPSQQISVTIGAVIPKTDDLIDLGSTLLEFKDLYIDGVANIDSLVADTADINAGTIDGVIIGGTVPAAATVTSLVATSGTVGGVAITTASNTQTLTNKTLNLTSNTLTATSAQLAAALTDETGTGSVVFSASPALTGTPTAPTAIAATNTTQLATTAHVFAERANTATLTNKTLTSPTINTATITGGTISGITDLAVLDGGTGSSTAAGALVNLGLTATAAELNTLDGILPTVTELNYVDGVTSAIQTQLDGKIGAVTAGTGLTGGGTSGDIALALDIATQLEAETGTDNTSAMTPLRTAQAIDALAPLSKFYESTEQTVVAGGLLTLAHGMGVAPKHITYHIVCQVADDGYSIGDVVDFAPAQGSNYAATTAVSTGLGVKVDATNITIRAATGSLAMSVNATTGAPAAFEFATWKLIVRAWA